MVGAVDAVIAAEPTRQGGGWGNAREWEESSLDACCSSGKDLYEAAELGSARTPLMELRWPEVRGDLWKDVEACAGIESLLEAQRAL